MATPLAGTTRRLWLPALLAAPLGACAWLVVYALDTSEETARSQAEIVVRAPALAAVRARGERARARVAEALADADAAVPTEEGRLAAGLRLGREADDATALRLVVAGDEDPRVRIAALEGLARLGDRGTLLATAVDAAGHPTVRRHAARLLGRLGEAVIPDLEAILASETSEGVAGGAIRGLGETRTAKAATRLVELAAERRGALRDDAVAGIAAVAGPASADVLRSALAAKETASDVRAAICRGIARTPGQETTAALAAVLADASAAAETRAAAADALGRLGDPSAADALANATRDASPEVAREAQIAASRIRR